MLKQGELFGEENYTDEVSPDYNESSDEILNFTPDFEDLFFLAKLYDSKVERFKFNFNIISETNTTEGRPMYHETLRRAVKNITENGVPSDVFPSPEDLMLYVALGHLRQEEVNAPDNIKDMLGLEDADYETQITEYEKNTGEYLSAYLGQLKMLPHHFDTKMLEDNLKYMFQSRANKTKSENKGTKSQPDQNVLTNSKMIDKFDHENFFLIPPNILNIRVNLPGLGELPLGLPLPTMFIQKDDYAEPLYRGVLVSGVPFGDSKIISESYAFYSSIVHLVVAQIVTTYQSQQKNNTFLHKNFYIDQSELFFDFTAPVDPDLAKKVHLLHVKGNHNKETDFLELAGLTYGLDDDKAMSRLCSVRNTATVFLEKVGKFIQIPEVKKALYSRKSKPSYAEN